MNATIHERGNGFPSAGDYVAGDDGELYRVVSITGRIQTGQAGVANWIEGCEVELADWADCTEEAQHTASAVIETDDNEVTS